MLLRGLPQSLWLIEKHDRTQRAFRQLKEVARPWFGGWPEKGWRLPCSSVEIRSFRHGNGPFHQGQERGALNRGNRALCAGIKFADGFNGVAEQLDTHGTRGFWRENVDDSAAHGKLPRQLDHFGSRVAHGAKMGDQFIVWNVGVFGQRTSEIEVSGGILIAPKRGGNGRDQQRDLAVRDPKESGGAAFENVGVRALRFPRKPVEGRERGDASSGPGKDGAEEAQCFGESFGAAIGAGDKKGGTPQLARQVSGNEGFRDVMQSGNRDMACAGAQSGQRALHRRMAKNGLQSLADGRKYHAWPVRNPRERRAPL